MAVFIKVSKDGKYLYFVKTLFSNEISQNEFVEKADMASIDEFLNKYSNKLDESIKNKISRIQQIADMKLSALGCVESLMCDAKSKNLLYLAGDEIFSSEDYTDAKKEALEYAKRFYGAEFMKDKIDLLEDKEVICFSKQGKISFYEYKALINELEELTKIISIKKDINRKNIR